MKYFGKVALPIKSMDARGTVIYVGTFSKVVFPGLRVGWVVASPELVRLIVAVQRASSLAVNSITQAALHRFCEAGRYDAHLRRLHTAYRRRLQVLLDGLDAHLPNAGVSWTRPRGGYTLWLQTADFEILEILKPLAAGSEPFPWASETRVAPWHLYVLGQRTTKSKLKVS